MVIRRHGGYTDRYHGPDDITLKDDKLTEWEAKASKTDGISVAKGKHGNRQGSRDKNLLLAKTMTRKEKKIGMPSNRQGRPYPGGDRFMAGCQKLGRLQTTHLRPHQYRDWNGQGL